MGQNALYETNMLKRESGLSIGMTLTYGYKAIMKNPVLWLAIGAVVGVIMAVVNYLNQRQMQAQQAQLQEQMQNVMTGSSTSANVTVAVMTPTMAIVYLVTFLVGFLVSPILYAVVLTQLDGEAVTMETVKARMNYVQTLISTVLVGLVLILLSSTSMWAPSLLSLFVALIVSLLVSLVALIVTPLLCLAPWFASESRASGLSSIGASFATAKKSYFPFLGLLLILGVIFVVGSLIVSFGGIIGMIVGAVLTAGVTPLIINALGHAYRQMSGAPYPQM